MRLTVKSSYALNIIGHLAEHQLKEGAGRVSAKEIASVYGLSESFVTSILGELKLANLADSKKGPNGGYTLSREASKITIQQIFEAINEQPLSFQMELFNNTTGHSIMVELGELLSNHLSKPVSEFMSA